MDTDASVQRRSGASLVSLATQCERDLRKLGQILRTCWSGRSFGVFIPDASRVRPNGPIPVSGYGVRVRTRYVDVTQDAADVNEACGSVPRDASLCSLRSSDKSITTSSNRNKVHTGRVTRSVRLLYNPWSYVTTVGRRKFPTRLSSGKSAAFQLDGLCGLRDCMGCQ